jgi:hypothetical protein
MLPDGDIIIDYEISAEDTRIFRDSINLGHFCWSVITVPVYE